MGRTKRGRLRNVTLEAQAARHLYSQGNDQAKIGAVLGVSQGEVSRLLGNRPARRLDSDAMCTARRRRSRGGATCIHGQK